MIAIDQEQFLSSFEDGSVFILVDPYLQEPKMLDDVESLHSPSQIQKARQTAWDGAPIHTINLEDWRIPPLQMPYLVECSDKHSELIVDAFELYSEQMQAVRQTGSGALSIGGWLQSKRAGEQLADALSDMCALVYETQTKPRYLRTTDPRVLYLLRAQFPQETQHWLSPIDRWVFWNLRDEIQVIHNPNPSQQATALCLPQSAQPLIQLSEGINRSLAGLAHHAEPAALSKVIEAVMQAKQAGWDTGRDQAAYAVYAVQYPTFEHTHAAQAAFAQAKEEQIPLADALMLNAPEDWASAIKNTL
jgi:hypothetical protein